MSGNKIFIAYCKAVRNNFFLIPTPKDEEITFFKMCSKKVFLSFCAILLIFFAISKSQNFEERDYLEKIVHISILKAAVQQPINHQSVDVKKDEKVPQPHLWIKTNKENLDYPPEFWLSFDKDHTVKIFSHTFQDY